MVFETLKWPGGVEDHNLSAEILHVGLYMCNEYEFGVKKIWFERWEIMGRPNINVQAKRASFWGLWPHTDQDYWNKNLSCISIKFS